jgi:hypothetical protein
MFIKRMKAGGFLLPLLGLGVLLMGCGPRFGPHITVKWPSLQSQIVAKTPVRYMGTETGGQAAWLDLGEVIKVSADPAGTVAEIGLYKNKAQYVTTKTTFIVRSGSGAPIFIEAKVFDKDAPPIQDGAVLSGADSEIEAQVRQLMAGWSHSTAMILALVVGVILLVLIARLILHLWAVIACLAGGAACAWYFASVTQSAVTPYLPQGVRPDLAGYALGFLGGYIASIVLLALLRAPLKIGK